MSQQQKDALKEMLRNAPLDIGGDAIEQRANFEKMLSAQPLADDVSTTAGELGIDPVFTREKVSVRAADYVGSADPADPSISPIFADLHGLPPILIQAGSHEILLDDSIRLARRAAVDDVDVTLDVTPGVPHGFQAFAAILDEGDAALARAAAFLDHHLSWVDATT